MMRRFLAFAALSGSLFIAPCLYAADVRPLAVIVPDEVEKLNLAQLEARSAKGDLKAQAELGARYARGDGVAADMKKAISLFETAAKKGEANAQFYLGTAYDMGAGVDKDPVQAAHWFGEAASRNHAGGQLALAVMMTDGQGNLKADPEAAAALVAKSAEQGYVPAALRMASLHIAGLGVPRDTEQAANWYRRILKTHDTREAIIKLMVLFETREATWQPGDPGAPPPPEPSPVPQAVETAQAGVMEPVVIRKSGIVSTKTFRKDGGITFTTRAEDGRLTLYGRSRTPTRCEARVVFSYDHPDGTRKDGDMVCFQGPRPAGKTHFWCDSNHHNFFKTEVKDVEITKCADTSAK